MHDPGPVARPCDRHDPERGGTRAQRAGPPRLGPAHQVQRDKDRRHLHHREQCRQERLVHHTPRVEEGEAGPEGHDRHRAVVGRNRAGIGGIEAPQPAQEAEAPDRDRQAQPQRRHQRPDKVRRRHAVKLRPALQAAPAPLAVAAARARVRAAIPDASSPSAAS